MKLCENENFRVIDGIKNKQKFIEFAKTLGEIYHQKDDPKDEGLVTLRYDESIHKYGFTNQALYPHTDRSNMLNPPDIALLWYEKKPTSGGESLVFDAAKHLLPVIDGVNFSAVFGSENDDNKISACLYDAKTNIFRFRNDAYISLNSPEDKIKFAKAQKLIDQNTIELPLEEAQCLVINNKQILHGRRAFVGDRLMHRILVYKK